MKIVPLHLRQANDFVTQHHRHHKPLRIAKFSIGCEEDGKLVGVAICMRPACRALDNGKTLEVSRVATDGTKDACSKLYGACARIAKEMGYEKVQTYILDSEPGTSLKASGWKMEKAKCGGTPQGNRTGRRPHKNDETHQLKIKSRWGKVFAEEGKASAPELQQE